MKSTKTMMLVILLAICSYETFAQAQVKSYSMKKGQVLDLLLISLKPNSGGKLKTYFDEVYPVAEVNGHHKLPLLKVIDIPTQGNYHPDAIVFGFWDSVDSRPDFLKAIEEKIPTFHEIRRDIWSTFCLAYFELEEDLDFEIDPTKFNVMTNYWSTGESSFISFSKEWINQVKKAGGRITMELSDSKSPFGYLYDPRLVTITTWESKEAFDAFLLQNGAMDHKGVKHVNQFAIQ